MNDFTLDLSITVVSHNHERFIKKYLPSVFSIESKSTFEILLIDNTSKDGTADWVRENLPQVSIIHNEHPKSYSANVNMGIRLLKHGRYFVALNPDTRCLPGLFDKAVEFMDANPGVGIMGPQILYPDGTIQDSCRSFSTPFVTLLRGLRLDGMLKNNRAVRCYLMRDFDHTRSLDVDWVMGALMFVRRQAIEEVGGMDERYEGAYSEDQDWCCRMWQREWRVTYFPNAQAIHDHQRIGVKKPWSKMTRMQLINSIRMFRKFNWRLSRQAMSQSI